MYRLRESPVVQRFDSLHEPPPLTPLPCVAPSALSSSPTYHDGVDLCAHAQRGACKPRMRWRRGIVGSAPMYVYQILPSVFVELMLRNCRTGHNLHMRPPYPLYSQSTPWKIWTKSSWLPRPKRRAKPLILAVAFKGTRVAT